jgi:hypothetical protein
VPVQLLQENPSGCTSLGCTQRQLATLRPFLEVEYVPDDAPYFAYETHTEKMWPYDTNETMPVSIQQETIPSNAVTLHRGAGVKATNGWVGQVVGFSVQLRDGWITHLVLRHGHLWRQKEVSIPISKIERIEKEIVHLKLDKRSLTLLPPVSERR